LNLHQGLQLCENVGLRIFFLDNWIGDSDNMQVRLYSYSSSSKGLTWLRVLAAASGIFTGVYSIVKNKPKPGFLTAAAVLNSGATASVFFGMFFGKPKMKHFC
jgi:hypothetical protein